MYMYVSELSHVGVQARGWQAVIFKDSLSCRLSWSLSLPFRLDWPNSESLSSCLSLTLLPIPTHQCQSYRHPFPCLAFTWH